jgi:hypothetical protein
MSDVPAQLTKSKQRPRTVQIGIVVGILVIGLVLTRLTSEVTRVSEPGIRLVNDRPFLPEKAGEWQGGELQGLSEILMPTGRGGYTPVQLVGHCIFRWCWPAGM